MYSHLLLEKTAFSRKHPTRKKTSQFGHAHNHNLRISNRCRNLNKFELIQSMPQPLKILSKNSNEHKKRALKQEPARWLGCEPKHHNAGVYRHQTMQKICYACFMLASGVARMTPSARRIAASDLLCIWRGFCVKGAIDASGKAPTNHR